LYDYGSCDDFIDVDTVDIDAAGLEEVTGSQDTQIVAAYLVRAALEEDFVYNSPGSLIDAAYMSWSIQAEIHQDLYSLFEAHEALGWIHEVDFDEIDEYEQLWWTQGKKGARKAFKEVKKWKCPKTGYTWDLLFRQIGRRYPLETPSQNLAVNSEDPSAHVFSRLDILKACSHEDELNWTDTDCDYRDADGFLTFKMVFPHRTDTPNYNIWKQKTNPVGMARGSPVEGFEPLHLQYKKDSTGNSVFGGLQKGIYENVALHNYDARNPMKWWYAIGVNDRRAWPGADGKKHERAVELYVLKPPG